MPSRAVTADIVLAAILPQLDHLFVYLDGFSLIPERYAADPKITATLLTGRDNVHASSRFYTPHRMARPALIILFDDDIRYPPDYVARIEQGFRRHGPDCVLGFHANRFQAPYRSYVTDRRCLHFTDGLAEDTEVDELGCGTAAFYSGRFAPRPKTWPNNHMDDLCMAFAAHRQGMPLISLARPAGWLQALAQNQPDSLWRRTKSDDSEHSQLMRGLIAARRGSASAHGK